MQRYLLVMVVLGLSGFAVAVDQKYQCGSTCSGERIGCNCNAGCLANNTCCTDYLQNCVQGGTSWVDDPCDAASEMTCPEGFDKSPLLIFSVDGFRNIYLYRNLSKNLMKLAQCGAHAPYLRPVYPSKTFTSHYAAITGLYAESNGIIDNKMYDHEQNELFSLGSQEFFHPFWWGGEPFWVTVSNQGLKSATYFYPGSDVNITRYPDYYYVYDGQVPNEERIQQGLKWFDLPAKDRPSLIVLYADIVDRAGHMFGPFSSGVDQSIAEMDTLIGMLMDGLKQRGLHKCVNIIIQSDHGMAPTSEKRMVFIEDYGVSLDNLFFRGGAFARIGPGANETLSADFNPVEAKEKLECHRDKRHWQVFLKQEYFPKRLHHANNHRIEDLHVKMDLEWLVEGNLEMKDPYIDVGSHGYDYEYDDIRTLFIGHGPGLKRSFNASDGFENIELYNLYADLLNVTAAPNNGTKGSLYHFLSSAKEIQSEPSGTKPNMCAYPNTDVSGDKLGCTECQSTSESDANKRLNKSASEASALQAFHMPYLEPRVLSQESVETDFCVLTQQDYVNFYDNKRKQPRFVSFTKKSKVSTIDDTFNCLRPDVRLPKQTSCGEYQNTKNITQVFLYDPALSTGDAIQDATLASNTLPGYDKFVDVGNYMTKTLNYWSEKYNGIHVTMGPVFDYNYDGLPDSDDVLLKQGRFLDDKSKETSTPIPTHIFLIITKCSDVTKSIDECVTSPLDIDVLSFLIPNFQYSFCESMGNTDKDDWMTLNLIEHIARVKDVELITGIRFFTKWSTGNVNQDTLGAAIRKKVNIQQWSGTWLKDFRQQNVAGSTIKMSPKSNLIFIVALFAFVSSFLY